MTRGGALLRRLALAAALAAAAVGAESYGLRRTGHEALTLSAAADARGDLPTAIVHAYRAACARVPFDGGADAGFDALFALATKARAQGDRSAFALALRAVDAAAVATRRPGFDGAAVRDRARAYLLDGAGDTNLVGRPGERRSFGGSETERALGPLDVRVDPRLELPPATVPYRGAALGLLVLVVLALVVPARQDAAQQKS